MSQIAFQITDDDTAAAADGGFIAGALGHSRLTAA
jgi:hypothetical protein